MNDKSMPSVKELFVESWEAMRLSFGNVFLLGLFGLGINILLTVAVGLWGWQTGVWSAFAETFSGDPSTYSDLITNGLGVGTIVGFVAIFLVFILVVTLIRIATMIAVGKYKERPNMSFCLRAGFASLFQWIVLGLIVWLLVMGSSMLLVIPGIIVSLFLYFTNHELVIGGKKWFAAMRGSVQIMSQHLGEVILRMLLMIIFVLVVYYLPISILGALVGSPSGDVSAEAAAAIMTLSVARFLIGMLLGYFMMAYSIVVYLQAKKSTNENTSVSLLWMVILGVVGFVVGVIVMYKIGSSLMSQNKTDLTSSEVEVNLDKMSDSLTEEMRLKMWKEEMSPEAKDLYEQSMVLFGEMKTQASNRQKVTEINNRNIDLLKKAVEIDSENPELWATLSDAYTWVNTRGSLKDALKASEKAEELDGKSWSYANRTAEILLMGGETDKAILKFKQVIRMEDNYGRAHLSLGYAYSKAGVRDLAKVELQKGIDILSKYNSNGGFDMEILEAQKELGKL